MVCVDRLITSACFESVNGGRESEEFERQTCFDGEPKKENGAVLVVENSNGGEGSSCSAKKVKEMVECRICQEEDEVHEMEAPCACNGSLKFAHRKCIQRWCNKKGDITCEICNKIFSPNYSLPPQRSSPDVLAIDISQAWGPHMNLRDSHLIVLAAASERQYLQSEYEDYAGATTGSIACLRSVAFILLMVLLLHQALMVTRDSGLVQESSTFFRIQISLLQFTVFLLPCYIVAQSCYLQSRRRRQG